MAVESDHVAMGVTMIGDGNERDLLDNQVVTVAGWVKANQEPILVFLDQRFEVSLAISADDVVHQVTGAEHPEYDGRSVLWINRDAVVTTCVRENCVEATAGFFADVAAAKDDKPPPPRK